MIPEPVRVVFKAAWTPPYWLTYVSWHSDLNDEKTYAEIITQDKVDPRMRVRPNPAEVERAAKLLVEAKMPLMIVGDEVYGAKAASKAVDLRSEEHTSELQSLRHLVCRLLLEKKKKIYNIKN